MDILLSDEQWQTLWDEYRDGGRGTQTLAELKEWKDYLCMAQKNQIVEWLEETCEDHGPFTREGFSNRRLCPVCWATFKEAKP